MSQTVPKKIIIDDRSTELQYSGAWAVDSSKPRNQIGIISTFIPASSHKATEAGSSFSFSFEGKNHAKVALYMPTITPTAGTSVEVHGSVFGNASQTPTYSCSLDSASITVAIHDPPSAPGTWTMCDTTMINGPYTLSVNVTDPGPIGLWFDYLIYEPGDPQTAVKSNIYRIDKSDPAIVYSSGWGMFGDFANGTNTPNAQLSLTFEGQGISFLGYTAAELPHPAAVASYSIDRGPPVNFSLNGIDGNSSSSIFDLELFGVTGLAPGSHDLSVVYLGDKTKTALALNYFQVLGSIPGSNITTNSTASPTSPTQPPSNPNHDTPSHHASHLSTGAIVGILVGVSFFVSMAVGLFFFMRKRGRPPGDIETRRPQSGWLSTFKSYQRELAEAGPGPSSFSSSIVSPQTNPQSYDRYTSAPSIRSSTEQIHYTQRLSPVRRKMPSYDMGGGRIQPPSRALARNASAMTEVLPQYSA